MPRKQKSGDAPPLPDGLRRIAALATGPQKQKEPAMAKDDTSPNADFIGRVVSDAKNPPEARMLSGWFGDAGEEGYRRLYTSADLSAYVDIPSDAILYTEAIRDVQPAGGVFVWIRRDAALKPGGSAAGRAARFLQGQVQQDFASGGGSGSAGGAVPDADSLRKAGYRCITQVPCAEPTGLTNQCTKQPDVGGAWPCITAPPHCAEPTGFSGRCTHQPWPNPTQYLGCTVYHCPTRDLTHIPHICNIVASGIPGCGGVNPPDRGGDPAVKAADAEQEGHGSPAAADNVTTLPGCGFTKLWGPCDTQLLGCGITANCGNPLRGIPQRPTFFPLCQQARAAAPIASAAVCPSIGGCPSLAVVCPSLAEGCTVPASQLCTQSGPACPTTPKTACTHIGAQCPTACGLECQSQQVGCTTIGPVCHPRCTQTDPECPSVGIICTQLPPQCPKDTPFLDCTFGFTQLCLTKVVTECPFEPDTTVFTDIQPQAFAAAAIQQTQGCIHPTIWTQLAGCTQFGPQCPTQPNGDCTFFNCPTQACPPTPATLCTQIKGQCPTQPNGDCTFFNCPTPECPRTPATACTQFGPQCPTQPNGDCTFFNCPTLQKGCPPTPDPACTQFGPQCPTQPNGDCTFFNCPTLNPVCAQQRPAAAARQNPAIGGYTPWYPTPATRCFICPPFGSGR
jgi:hypothetical protein